MKFTPLTGQNIKLIQNNFAVSVGINASAGANAVVALSVECEKNFQLYGSDGIDGGENLCK